MVSSYLQLLERRYKDKLDSDAEDFINFAVDGAQRMHKLIADLVSYSRINTRGNGFEPTDFNQVLDRALAAANSSALGSAAVITRDALPALIADAGQLEQLFGHLIDNALKFQNGRRPLERLINHSPWSILSAAAGVAAAAGLLYAMAGWLMWR